MSDKRKKQMGEDDQLTPNPNTVDADGTADRDAARGEKRANPVTRRDGPRKEAIRKVGRKSRSA